MQITVLQLQGGLRVQGGNEVTVKATEQIGRVAVMDEPEKLSYQEYKLPEPEPETLLLKDRRTNICGSELHIWRGQLHDIARAARSIHTKKSK